MACTSTVAIPAVSILAAERIAREGIDLLRAELPGAQIDEYLNLTPAALRAAIGHYTVLIVRSATEVSADLLEAAHSLRIVARAGAGVDNIDSEAAQRLGIAVLTSPTGNVIAAAEHTIAMLLALARHIPAACMSTKAGQWEKQRFLGIEVAHKTLGILGFGKVGREVARRARGLDMHVVAYDPYVPVVEAASLGVMLVGLEEMLARADVVSLHANLTAGPDGTRGMLGAGELRLLKPDARLINCARGGLIDEEALRTVLNEGRLAGVALDVFSQEPVRDSAVLQQIMAHERVIVTPHLGASTAEAQVRVATDVARQIVDALRLESLAFPASLAQPQWASASVRP